MRERKTCVWIINAIGRLTPIVQCGAPATHYEPDGDAQFCHQHAEDYEDVFGEVLNEFPIEDNKP